MTRIRPEHHHIPAPRPHSTTLLAVTLLALTAICSADSATDHAAPDAPATTSATWHVLGLGDSITAGQACDGCTKFLDLYAHEIAHAANTHTIVTNLGVSGTTSADLLQSLTDQRTIDQVTQADIVVITIGANDFNPMLETARSGTCGGADQLACFAGELHQLRTNLEAILHDIHSARGPRPTAIRVTGYWNVFLDGRVADATYGEAFHHSTDELTHRANSVIRTVAQTNAATYVDLFTTFRGIDGVGDDTALLADDGVHPNQAGHQRIAESLALTGLAPLAAGAMPAHPRG